ncbi:MAG: efflux RND transporter periplasmic adaptor subunit [Proteobacteria bacterium]|nr:efflux RND transporter periplasmic adaptor subunit [Pseudomonadota bacterium]
MAHIFAAILTFFGLMTAPIPPKPPVPPRAYVVQKTEISDEKSVFATVESVNVVPARVRTGGTILELKVRQGDRVEQGQVIATVGDQKLALTISSYAAQVQAAQAQLTQAKVEYERAQRLIASGAVARSVFDQAHTAYNVAVSNLKSIIAQRDVVQQQQSEGQVLAPTAGRVITVPVTAGTVVMSGDAVATVAEQNFVLRLQIPERHALYLKIGDPVRLDDSDLGLDGPRFGTINLVYPGVENGHVVADATVKGLTDYFVGQRVRVWISAGKRQAIVVPATLITTRFGIDYARIWTRADGAIDVPVQRGQEVPRPGMPNGLEILSGLKPGDRLLDK